MKKIICFILSLMLIGGVLMTGCEPSELVVEKPKSVTNLRVWTDSGTVITDGSLEAIASAQVTGSVTLEKDPEMPSELTFTDWYSNTHTEALEYKGVSVFVDCGFCVNGGKISLPGVTDDIKYKVYASDDGYNFTRYLGEFSGDTVQFVGSFKAFNIVFDAEKITLIEVKIIGTSVSEKVLLSKGASYTWEGMGMRFYSDENGDKLTDGVYYDGTDSTVVAKNSHEEDQRTGKSGNVITVDLGNTKNVSEVSLNGFLSGDVAAALPQRISVRYSVDGEQWLDFGQSFLVWSNGTKNGCCNRFTVTRPFTVEARYVRIYTYVDGIFGTDEIEVWGSKDPVAEPVYEKLSLPKGDADVAKGWELKDGAVNIDAPAGVKYVNLVSTAPVTFTEQKGKVYENSAAGIYTTLLKLANPTEQEGISLAFECEGEITLAQAFTEEAHTPVVDGGFYQLPTNGGNDVSTQNDGYSWYLSLKGMRDLGMSTVIIQYSTHYNAKTTLINGENITAAGYKYTATYGTEDLCLSVLDAAEKLGMKVFIGTIHDADFTNPSTANYDGIIADSQDIITDIYNMYSDHAAFGGYYLSDETCDYWLNFTGGVEAARKVYKAQSDLIRRLDEDGIIMIAPAIWRSGSPQKAEEKLYELIRPEKEGEKPVVDIVAVQDCLGREQTLTVSDQVYLSWLEYCGYWKKGIEKAGAEFWHDAEVFEINYSSKRFSETEKSLTLQYSLSGAIVVFDIPHYMTPMPLWTRDDWKGVYKMNEMKEYIEYYENFR